MKFNIRRQMRTGDILCGKRRAVAYISENNSTYTGMLNTGGEALRMEVSLDRTSGWDLTGESYVSAVRNDEASMLKIKDNGNTIYYEAENSANEWLNKRTYVLQDGGTLRAF